MTVKPSKFNTLIESMPAFSFAADSAPEWLRSAEVKAYLKYYNLDFSHSLEGVQHRFGHIKAGNYRIAMHSWVPEIAQGTVFLLHGYFDHVGLYQHLIRFLLKNQLTVVSFDIPGHGLSSGERATIASFDTYSKVLLRCLEKCNPDKRLKDYKAQKALLQINVPRPWYVVAQSTGAAATLNYLVNRRLARDDAKGEISPYRQAPEFDRIVLLSPLVRAYGWNRRRWGYELLRPFVKRIPRTFPRNSHDPDFLEFVKKKDPLQAHSLSLRWVTAKKNWIKKALKFPVCQDTFLVIQGDSDTTVDWPYNTALIQKKFPNSELMVIPGARHQLINESIPYRAKVFQKLLKYLLANGQRAAKDQNMPLVQWQTP